MRIIVPWLICLMPFLIANVKANCKGIITGLLVPLIYLCSFNGILLSIPLFPLLFIGFNLPESSTAPINTLPLRKTLKRPAFFMLILFLLSFSFFCALSGSSGFFPIEKDQLIASKALRFAFWGAVVGPVFFGWLCDKKSVLFSAMSLSLAGSLGVCCRVNSMVHPAFLYMGNLFTEAAIYGFWVVLPQIVILYFGSDNFRKVYLFFYIPLLSAYSIVSVWGKTILSESEILFSLTVLSTVAAMFLYLWWQRRYFLIK